MARIRTIKPDFWVDEKIVELSAFARLLFIGLWNFADDEGRMVFSEKKIKMQIFPADNLNISELFGEIRREGLVNIYLVDNQEYLEIVNFAKHQKIDKRSASKLPSSENPPESPRIPPTEGIKEREKEDIHTSEVSAVSAAKPLVCPHEKIIEIYHECFPAGQKVLLARYRGSKREKQLTSRWREDQRHRATSFWIDYFSAAAAIPWLTGTNERGWIADFEYLTSRRGFDRVLEQVVDG